MSENGKNVDPFEAQIAELKAQAEKGEKQSQMKLEEMLTVRDRLLRRVTHTIIKVPFVDDVGTFNVNVRMLTEAEQRRTIELQQKLAGITDVEKYAVLIDELISLIAYPKGVCLDSTLDETFWKSGSYAINDLFKLLSESITGSNRAVAEASSFRQK